MSWRILILLPVLAGISAILFTILVMAPGDPFEELATNPNVPPEVRMNLRAKFGLDDPLPVRYARWVASMMRGDWGFSFVSRVNVDTLILQRLPTTLIVLGSAQLLAILIAVPIGTYSALRPYSIFDQIATTLAFIGFSLPTFFTGLLFILLFTLHLSIRYQRDGLALVLGAPSSGDHAGGGSGSLPGRLDDALHARRRARRDPPRLRQHGACEGALGEHDPHQARRPQRADPGRDPR